MKPTQRFKQRYVAFTLRCKKAPTGGESAAAQAFLPYAEAKQLVHEHFLSYFGEEGIAKLAFKFVKYNDKNGNGILRCERGKVDETIFCMALLSEWREMPARLEPNSTSGTIRRL